MQYRTVETVEPLPLHADLGACPAEMLIRREAGNGLGLHLQFSSLLILHNHLLKITGKILIYIVGFRTYIVYQSANF